MAGGQGKAGRNAGWVTNGAVQRLRNGLGVFAPTAAQP